MGNEMNPTSSNPSIRHSVRELEKMHASGTTKPRDMLLLAWQAMKSLPPTDPQSFFVVGGYHGEPFVAENPQYKSSKVTYYGGYCNHANVLFPLWHRIYVRELEFALQASLKKVKGIDYPVMMAYWDQTSAESLQEGVPNLLTQEKVTVINKEGKSETMDNPLLSFTFPVKVTDNEEPEKALDNFYTKPAKYTTVRYPLSGLVGTPQAKKVSKAHNKGYTDKEENVRLLNTNVTAYLLGKHGYQSIYKKYASCLNTSTYTLFSNTTSQSNYNNNNTDHIEALEDPHNLIHLSVGGFDNTMFKISKKQKSESGILPGANGDMGENNTAGLDPMFFFHHCNVDRVFWLWQKKKGHKIEIDSSDPGAVINPGQGFAAGQTPTEKLTLTTPLKPFKKPNSKQYYTGNDLISTEQQLDYTYSSGSLSDLPKKQKGLFHNLFRRNRHDGKKLHVEGLHKKSFTGSFIIRAYAVYDNEKHFVGAYASLNRWNPETCSNCQSHMKLDIAYPLNMVPKKYRGKAEYSLEFETRSVLPENLQYKLLVY